MKKVVLTLLTMLTIFPLAFSIDVLLVSKENYPDSLVAHVVSRVYGLAILITEKSELPNEVLNEVQDLNPEIVYIIGGPAVINDTIDENISSLGYQVVRIYGMTSIGTASEIAKYFWNNGSSEAVILGEKYIDDREKGNYRQALKAAHYAAYKQIPLLFTKYDELASETEDTLITLGVDSVKIFGNVSNDVLTRLEELNISYEVVSPQKERETMKEVEEVEKNKPLLVICIGNYKDPMKAVMHSGHLILIEKPEDLNLTQVRELMDKLNASYVKVTGEPTCAVNTLKLLRENGIDARLPGKKVIEVINHRIREVKERLKKLYALRRRILEHYAKKAIEKRIEKMKVILDKIETLPCVNLTAKKIEELINESENYLENNQTKKAILTILKAESLLRKRIWICRRIKDVREEVVEEIISIKKLARQKAELFRKCKRLGKGIFSQAVLKKLENPEKLSGNEIRLLGKLCYTLIKGKRTRPKVFEKYIEIRKERMKKVREFLRRRKTQGILLPI